MDYDSTSIPARYRTARQLPAFVMRTWLAAVRRSAPLPRTSRIADVGCGTGRFSTGLADTYSAHVVGIDRSAKMLAEVRSRHHHVSFLVADAEGLPFRRGSMDMVFLSNVIHHLSDLAGAAQGFADVLKSNGFVVVRNYVREQLRGVPYLEFFPDAYAASVEMLSSSGEIQTAFGRAGFELVSSRTVEQPVAASPSDYLAKVKSRTYSDLVAIPDDAFNAGVARMSAVVATGWQRALHEPLHLLSFRKTSSA
jgi:ubiquinone/menaquinone biosynthesis C-methylase UbiE